MKYILLAITLLSLAFAANLRTEVHSFTTHSSMMMIYSYRAKFHVYPIMTWLEIREKTLMLKPPESILVYN